MLDLMAAGIASQAPEAAMAFSAQIATLPQVGAVTALRLVIERASRTLEVSYLLRERPQEWLRCISGALLPLEAAPAVSLGAETFSDDAAHLDSKLAELGLDGPQQRGFVDAIDGAGGTIRLRLSQAALSRLESARYCLHPRLLGLCLRVTAQLGAANVPGGPISVRSIRAVRVFAPGATPATILFQRTPTTSGSDLSITLLDQQGLCVALLEAVSPHGPGEAAAREPVTALQLCELVEACTGRAFEPSDDWLTAGLHSLDLVRIANAVHERWGTPLPLHIALRHASVVQLLQLLNAQAPRPTSKNAVLLERVLEREPATTGWPQPLCAGQRALWLASQQPGARDAYEQSAAFRLRGTLDGGALQRAFSAFVGAHESCRSWIGERAGTLVQTVLSPSVAALAQHAWPATEAPSVAALERWASDYVASALPDANPLVRGALLRITDDDHLLLLSGHHALCDGTSFSRRLLPDLAEHYQFGRCATLPGLQPRHVAHWEACPEVVAAARTQLDAWASALAQAPAELGRIDVQRGDPGLPGARYCFDVPTTVTTALRALAAREHGSLFVTTLSVFRAALYRWAQAFDLLIHVPVTPTHSPRFEDAFGCFVDFVPIRSRAQADLTWRDLRQEIAQAFASALERLEVPYALVQEQAARRGTPLPLAAVGFDLDSSAQNLELGGVAVERFRLPSRHSKLPLFLRLEVRGEQLRGEFEFASDLFDNTRIARLAAHFLKLLDAVGRDASFKLRDMPWLDATEQATLLAYGRGPAREPGLSLPEQFAAFVRDEPTRSAILEGSQVLSYQALAGRASGVAAALRDANVARGQPVALYLEAGIDWAVAVLGVWQAGAYFVAIEPDQPASRSGELLRTSQARVVLTCAANSGDEALSGWSSIAIDRLDSAEPTRRAQHQTRDASDVAYGMFTSGSTGAPKLALARHDGLANKLHAQRELFGLKRGARILQFASPAFDAALSELVLALGAGATLVRVPSPARFDGPSLHAFLREARIEAAMLTPSVMSRVPLAPLPDLELLLLVGEVCPQRLVDAWATPERRVFNLYGPAETTVWSSFERCQPGRAPGIGRPIANVNLYVLDADLNLLPAGESGEICIGGVAVGPGYRDLPELTARQFVADPFAASPGARMYRTGDLGCWLDDSRLMFLGRNDAQIKLHGRRVELTEIEARLRRIPGVEEAVVVATQVADSTTLVAYVTRREGEHCDGPALREALRTHLPRHMVPSSVSVLDAWPRLTSGKIDRTSLARRAASLHTAEPNTLSARERAVAQAFASVLEIPVHRIGPDDDFFALGGHSLGALSLARTLAAQLGMELPLRELLAAPSVRALAARRDGGSPPAVERRPRRFANDLRLAPCAVSRAAESSFRQVLLTGATGSLGGELLAQLLRDTDAQIVCPIRADDAQQAERRLELVLARRGLLQTEARRRVRAVRAQGDAAPLGLGAEDYARCCTEVDTILHVAATSNFVLPYEALRQVNVETTRAVIEIASTHRAKALHYVSSMSVLFPRADRSRDATLFEVPAQDPNLLMLGYDQTKAVSERLLLTAVERGLSVRIYRPTRVCPNPGSALAAHDVLALFLRSCVRLGMFPLTDASDNLLPVEHAAAGLLRIARKPLLQPNIFHLANPVGTPLRALGGALADIGHRLEYVSAAHFCGALADTELAPLQPFLEHSAVLGHGLPAIDTSHTRAAIGRLDCPTVDRAWLREQMGAWISGLLDGPH